MEKKPTNLWQRLGAGCCKTLYLHGASLMIAYQRGPPLNGDGFRQRHGTVRLISGEVLQAAGVCLFLPVLGKP